MAALTHSYALVASDRRITQTINDPSAPTGSRIISQEDTDTKTILLDRRYVMGFAGLGRIRSPRQIDAMSGKPKRQRIESWMVKALAGVDPCDYFEVLAEKFGRVCEEQNYNGPHTFLAVGYRTDGPRGATDPELVIVKNSKAMVHQFDVHREPLGASSFVFKTAGWDVDKELTEDVHRALATSVKRKPRQPDRLIPTLLHVMRETSHRSNGCVGTSALITTVPRVAVPLEGGMAVHMDTPGPEAYRERHLSISYPDENNPSDPRSFHAAMISSEFSMAGAMAEFGRTDSLGAGLGPF